MPKREIRKLELECEYCHHTEQFDLTADPQIMLKKLSYWNGVVNAGAPAGQGVPDQTKWYDSINCLVRGTQKDAEALKLEQAVALHAGEDPSLSPAANASGAVRAHH